MFIIIAWHPATGKTTLSKVLKTEYPNHTVLHTDDYMVHGYQESLYKLLEELESYKFENVIVEGIMWARLMRKLQELKKFDKVDLYVYISAKFDHIIDVYSRERKDKSLESVKSAIKWLDTVHAWIDLALQQSVNISISDFEEHDEIISIIKRHAP